MAFTTKWLQQWVQLPFQNHAGVLLNPWYLQWFTYDIDIYYETFDWGALEFATTNWVGATVQPICFSPSFEGPQDVEIKLYCTTQTLPQAMDFVPFYKYAAADVWPSTQNYTIRRFSNTLGQRTSGITRLCGVPKAWSDLNVLNLTGFTALKLCASNMTLPIVVDGCTFTPAIVSYQNVASYDNLLNIAEQKLTIVKRRGRHWRDVVENKPKAPPA